MGRSARLSMVHLWSAAALCAVVGCAAGPDSGAPDSGSPGSCRRGADCASLVCESEVCVPVCRDSGDCATDQVCVENSLGTRTCAAPCAQLPDDYVCIDDLPVACSDAPETACETCGCPGGTRCEVGVGCIELRDVGEACVNDAECSSANCSEFAQVCRVPVGQACTPDNCDYCMTATGLSFCSRECWIGDQCNGFECIGNRITDVFHCMPGCSSSSDASCPGTCRRSTDNTSRFYCDCDDCAAVTAARGHGQICWYDGQCASNDCLERFWTADSGGNVPIAVTTGFCTDACESDADCMDGTRCATVPCGAGESESTCGNKCLRPCTDDPLACDGYARGGTCRQLVVVDTAEVAGVCDAKGGERQGCYYDWGCVSGLCVLGRCAPQEGNPNGGVCGEPEDCASANCTGGTCRGNGLMGDSCMGAFDCSVGSCCTFGANENTCQTAC